MNSTQACLKKAIKTCSAIKSYHHHVKQEHNLKLIKLKNLCWTIAQNEICSRWSLFEIIILLWQWWIWNIIEISVFVMSNSFPLFLRNHFNEILGWFLQISGAVGCCRQFLHQSNRWMIWQTFIIKFVAQLELGFYFQVLKKADTLGGRWRFHVDTRIVWICNFIFWKWTFYK